MTKQRQPQHEQLYQSDDILEADTLVGHRSLASSNVALEKNACQSSTYPAMTYLSGPASRAVDGDTNGSWVDGSLSRTNLESDPWFIVELWGTYEIDRFKLWNLVGFQHR